MADLTKEQVGAWLATLSSGTQPINDWLADAGNDLSPFRPAVARLAFGVADGIKILQWLRLRIRRAELVGEKDAIDAILATLPTPTDPPVP